MQTICRWFGAIALLIPILLFGSIVVRTPGYVSPMIFEKPGSRPSSKTENTHNAQPMECGRQGQGQELYKALGENSNPSFATVLKIVRVIGV